MSSLFSQRLHALLARYIVAGAGGFATNMLAFALFLKVFGTHYVLASVAAFLVGAVASFLLQKLFAFAHWSVEGVGRQVVLHLLLMVFNSVMSGIIVYALVDMIGSAEFVAQALASVIIAAWSFFIYKIVIFPVRQA